MLAQQWRHWMICSGTPSHIANGTPFVNNLEESFDEIGCHLDVLGGVYSEYRCSDNHSTGN